MSLYIFDKVGSWQSAVGSLISYIDCRLEIANCRLIQLRDLIVPFLFIICAINLSGCHQPQAKEAVTTFWELHIMDSTLYGADGIRVGYFDQDTLADFISGGEEYGATRVFLNQGDLTFASQEFPSPNVEDALFTDLNGDNVPEVFTFSEGKTRHIAFHFMDSSAGWTSSVIPATEGIAWMYGAVADLDNNGTQEIIVGSKGENAVLGWLEISDTQDVAQWKLHTIASVSWVMSIEYLDMDADGHKDVLISDRKGEQSGIKWFRHPSVDSISLPWEETLIGLSGKEPMFLDIVDLNEDGRQDIIAADIAAGVFLFEKLDDNGKQWKDSLLFTYPEMVGNRGKSVACVDVDNDGAHEIVTSYEEAENAYGVIYSKYNRDTHTWDHFPISSKAGIKYDKILPFDIDNDGDWDIFTTEERENKNGLGVIWYENPTIMHSNAL